MAQVGSLSSTSPCPNSVHLRARRLSASNLGHNLRAGPRPRIVADVRGTWGRGPLPWPPRAVDVTSRSALNLVLQRPLLCQQYFLPAHVSRYPVALTFCYFHCHGRPFTSRHASGVTSREGRAYRFPTRKKGLAYDKHKVPCPSSLAERGKGDDRNILSTITPEIQSGQGQERTNSDTYLSRWRHAIVNLRTLLFPNLQIASENGCKYARSTQLRLLVYLRTTLAVRTALTTSLPGTGTHKYVLQANSDTALSRYVPPSRQLGSSEAVHYKLSTFEMNPSERVKRDGCAKMAKRRASRASSGGECEVCGLRASVRRRVLRLAGGTIELDKRFVSHALEAFEPVTEQQEYHDRTPCYLVWGETVTSTIEQLTEARVHKGLWSLASCRFGSPLVDGRPIMNAVKYRVVSCVVWTNRTMASSNTDTNRTDVLAAVDVVWSLAAGGTALPSWKALRSRVKDGGPHATHMRKTRFSADLSRGLGPGRVIVPQSCRKIGGRKTSYHGVTWGRFVDGLLTARCIDEKTSTHTCGFVAILDFRVADWRRLTTASNVQLTDEAPTIPALLRGHGGCAVSLLFSHQGDPGSIPGRVTPDSRMWESCRPMPLVGGLLRGSPPPPPPASSSRRRSILTSITPIGSEDLDVKSRPNLSTPTLLGHT
ncbi:hypothetical protein PR048_020570 [Dryococelus australis]|uniref:Uncharacterized protein n=1 Tax=Dryococelus australis TaxID=614101 RepID=A0ABQ9H6L5_9NEOP|nr:hypothetical protein PR048_020570 [Dryococelus australis]